MVERGEEDYIMEKGSFDVIKIDYKIFELSNDVFGVSFIRFEVLFLEIDVCSIVCNVEVLKQGGYNMEELSSKNSGILVVCVMKKV